MNEDLDLEVKARSFQDYLEENKRVKDILLWVWRSFLSEQGRRFIKQVFVLVFVSNLISIFTSYYAIRNIIDGVVYKNDSLLLIGFVSLGVLLMITRTLGTLRNIRREYFLADFGALTNRQISQMFFEKSLGTHTTEDRLLNESNVRKGNERLADMISRIVFDGPDLLAGLIIAFVALWFIHPIVGVIAAFLIITHLVWSGVVNYRIMIEGYPIEKKWRYLIRYRSERWKNIERVKVNAKEQEELNVLDRLYGEAIKLDLKLWIRVLKSWYGRGMVSIFIYVGALVYGVWQVRIGNLSAGWIYPLFSLTTQVFDNLWKVADLERLIHYNLWSVNTMREALNLPVGLAFKTNAVNIPKTSSCRVEFDSVSYRFKGEDSPLVLSDISFTVEPEEKVAIVGTSGAGKTTLMKLLLRCMDPSGGSIKIDGHDLRDINLASWLSIVGYIPQTSQVFNGTIRYNALYGLPMEEFGKVSDEYLWEQARMLQVDFGERLANGLDTVVGERGIKLSGGQNQRLMILAAAMKEPRFMIVDEATSSLDSSTEKLVQDGLEKALNRNCGALIIAHRLSTVRRLCNKFIVLEPVNGSGGKIVGMARGFEELYETCPQFRKLADDQEIKI